MAEELEPKGSVDVPKVEPILDAEWCFQFFDNDPVVFAYSEEGEEATALNLQIKSAKGEGLTFRQNGMLFKVFPRPISEETKLERAKSKENDVR